jgi:heme/copper-type cytochrome/quinol oxidase subunit 4
MKKLVLIIGVLLVLFNTFAGLIISAYEPFNYLLTDLSIILTTVFMFVLVSGKIDDGFKIGLSVLFCITGIVRFLLFMFISQQLENNGILLGVAGILALEIICLTIPFVAKKW